MPLLLTYPKAPKAQSQKVFAHPYLQQHFSQQLKGGAEYIRQNARLDEAQAGWNQECQEKEQP